MLAQSAAESPNMLCVYLYMHGEDNFLVQVLRELVEKCPARLTICKQRGSCVKLDLMVLMGPFQSEIL